MWFRVFGFFGGEEVGFFFVYVFCFVVVTSI